MWDLIKPLLNDVLQPIQDWIRKQRWLVKVLALFGLALVIFAIAYSEHAKDAVSLTGQTVRVVWSPGDALPLRARDQPKVRRVIDRLASDLSAKLAGGESDRGNAWITAQMVVAVNGLKQFDTASVVAYLDRKMGPNCPCWQEHLEERFTPHIGATAWALIALAKLNQAKPDQLRYLLRARSGDKPWWPISPGADEASTYATSLAVLALHQQLRLASLSGVDKNEVETAIRRGATWLREQMSKSKARWKDYPHPRRDPARVVESIGLSGQVLHILHLTYGRDLSDIERLWLRSLPSEAEVAEADKAELSNRDLFDQDGKAIQKEATKYYPLQWTVVGTVDAYGHGSVVECARALRLIEHVLGSIESQEQVALNAGNWVAAELLIALRHLMGESTFGRGWHTERK